MLRIASPRSLLVGLVALLSAAAAIAAPKAGFHHHRGETGSAVRDRSCRPSIQSEFRIPGANGNLGAIVRPPTAVLPTFS